MRVTTKPIKEGDLVFIPSDFYIDPPATTTNVVQQTEGYYVEFIFNGKVYDEAGPFDEEWEADEVASR